MKFLKYSLCAAVFALLVVSCVKDINTDVDYQQKYVGAWQCNETTGRNAPQFYTVKITAGADLSTIYIENLYNNPDIKVSASIAALSLSIPNQTSAGTTISGTGQATSDFDQISLDFIANDGTGNDTVSAKLIK